MHTIRLYLCFSFLLPFSLSLLAQDSNTDSLKIYWELAAQQYQKRNFGEALQYYQAGFELCKQQDSLQGRCLACVINMAAMYDFMGKGKEADSTLHVNASLMRALPIQSKKVFYLNKWIEILIDLGQLDQAWEYVEEAYEMMPSDSLQSELAKINSNAAQIYFLWGRYDQADSLYQEISSYNRQIGDRQALAASYTNRGRLLEKRGDLERARQMYQEAMNINREVGRLVGLIINGNNLGVILRKQGKNQAALKQHQAILQQADSINYAPGIAFQHLNIGINASHLGRKEIALPAFLAAVESFESQGATLQVSDTYQYIADLYWRNQEYTKAEATYRKAISELPNIGSSEYHSMAWLKLARFYQDRGQSAACLEACQNSLFHSAPGFTDGNPLYHPTTDLVQIELDAIDALLYKGQVLWQEADSSAKAAGYQSFQIAQDLIQELLTQYQTSSSQGDMLEDYTDVIEGLLLCQAYYHEQTGDAKWLDQIWETLEVNKATRLRAALRNAQIPIRGQLPEALYQRQISLRTQIQYERLQAFKNKGNQTSQQALLNLLNQQDSLMREIKNRYPAYYSMQYAPQALGRKELQNDLGPNELVCNYFVGEKQIWVYGLSQQDDKLWKLAREEFPQQYWPKWRELSQQIEQEAYAPDWYADFTQKAYETYQKLLAPATEMLPPEADWHITIIPDGFVAHIPFAILLTEPSQTNSINYRNLAYLLQRASIRYLGAASLAQQNYAASSQASYLGFAPGQAGVFGEALAYSQEEVKHGQAIWGGETYIGALASESEFKQHGTKAQILHIAAHGTIHDSLPLRSALSLAPGEEEDGRLEIAELYNLSFDNQLAILSACESGQGSWRAGEGLISLANGFHYGGCPNVLMSRWAVRDASTLPILEDFLESAYQGKSPEEALRKAQLQYLAKADLAHPFFWAGWMISGPTQPLEQERAGWEYYMIAFLVALGAFAYWRNAQPSSDAWAA